MIKAAQNHVKTNDDAAIQKKGKISISPAPISIRPPFFFFPMKIHRTSVENRYNLKENVTGAKQHTCEKRRRATTYVHSYRIASCVYACSCA